MRASDRPAFLRHRETSAAPPVQLRGLDSAATEALLVDASVGLRLTPTRKPRSATRISLLQIEYGTKRLPANRQPGFLLCLQLRRPWRPYLLIALANTYLSIAGLDP